MIAVVLLALQMRGVSVAHDGAVWASSQHGVLIHAAPPRVDAAASRCSTGRLRSRSASPRSCDDDQDIAWEVDTIAAARTFDLRGIAAVDHLTAHAMVAGADTGRIFVTTDGGRTWRLEYDDTRHGVFLDAIALWSRSDLIVLGDPIGDAFTVLVSRDSGAHWTAVHPPPALPGEAAFAASNTCLVTGPGGAAWFVTGGSHTVARVFHTGDYGSHWSVMSLPLLAGNASSGAFSIAFRGRHGVVVGGDYAVPDSSRPNVALTIDGGATWSRGPGPGAVPYLSAVAPLRAGWIATGTRGTWISRDDGHSWARADTVAYNAIAVTPTHAILLGTKVERIADPTR